jgi:four helix bundle protein
MIIDFCEKLEAERKFIIAAQLLKSGTSIGANIREAQNAESKNDFIHKFKIAAKECDETIYWLEICKEIDSYPFNPELIEQIEIISKIINKIISSSKNRT